MKRILTALSGFLIFFSIFFYFEKGLHLLWYLIFLFSLFEAFSILGISTFKRGILLILSFFSFLCFDPVFYERHVILLSFKENLFTLWVFLIALFIFSGQNIKEDIDLYSKAFFLVFYFLNLRFIFKLEGIGKYYILYFFFFIWAYDIGAYYIGSKFGRHKIAPKFSPKKSFEGFFGGILISMIIGFLFKYFYFKELSWYIPIVLAVILGIFGHFGDIFESVWKRAYKVKDSGSILPGHGGIWDRIDAIIFALPIYVFLVSKLFVI